MESLRASFVGTRAFVTGHTGFKGSWMCEWLLSLGVDVFGFALAPPTRPALFRQLRLEGRVHHTEGDIRDDAALTKAVAKAQPDYVFHLAAQPIVRTAHADPAGTWSTNVMGTVNLLEAVRKLRRTCAVVVVTTDKVYGSSGGPHKEGHPLGALDPYGASKVAVELTVAAWRQAFFPVPTSRGSALPFVALATARSGNVIGGGDWAKDRLLPDCVRALSRGVPIAIRNPQAERPWQHVLDPLLGYLRLAAGLRTALLLRDRRRLADLSGPFNFGPSAADHRPVREVVAQVLKLWPGKCRRDASPQGPPETEVLRLNADKARRVLGWRPRWGFEKAVDQTVGWYQGAISPAKASELTFRQLSEFAAD